MVKNVSDNTKGSTLVGEEEGRRNGPSTIIVEYTILVKRKDCGLGPGTDSQSKVRGRRIERPGSGLAWMDPGFLRSSSYDQ